MPAFRGQMDHRVDTLEQGRYDIDIREIGDDCAISFQRPDVYARNFVLFAQRISDDAAYRSADSGDQDLQLDVLQTVVFNRSGVDLPRERDESRPNGALISKKVDTITA